MDLDTFLLETKYEAWTTKLCLACRYNRKDFITYVINQDSADINWALSYTCQIGYKDIALFLIEKGANNWNWALCGACNGGHMDLALLMIKKGANNLDSALNCACNSGHIDLVLLLINKGAVDFTTAIGYACIGENIDIIVLMISKGANPNYGLNFTNNRNIILLLLEHGASINACKIELTEFDIEYLFLKNVKKFGKYTHMIYLFQKRRKIAGRVFKKLNIQDVDTIILSY